MSGSFPDALTYFRHVIHRRRVAACAVGAVLIAAGCASSPKPSAEAPVTPAASVAKPAQPLSFSPAAPGANPSAAQQTPTDVDPSTAVQKQAEAYTQLMQPLIDQRAKQMQSAPSGQWQGAATPPGGAAQNSGAMARGPSEATASADAESPPSLPTLQSPRLGSASVLGRDGSRSGDGDLSPERAVAMQQLTAPAPALGATPAADARAAAKTDPDELGTRLAARVRDDPRDVANQLELELHQMLLGDQVPKLDSLASLPAEDREVVTAIIDGLVNFRNGVRQDANQPLSQKVRPLLDMAARVRAQGDLAIPTVALCRKVQAFGVYEPIEAKFPVAREHLAILYCEVENFSSTPDSAHLYHTRLSQEVVLYTEQGQAVWSAKSAQVDDASRRQRQDFFLAWLIHIPQSLGIGQYILKVTVTDQQSNRVAEATLPLKITAAVDQTASPQNNGAPSNVTAAVNESVAPQNGGGASP